MANPFEDPAGEYLVLVNGEEQYSLWPANIQVPPGWSVIGLRSTRQECLAWIDDNWADMRPGTLRARMV